MMSLNNVKYGFDRMMTDVIFWTDWTALFWCV